MAILILTVPEAQRKELEAEPKANDTSNKPNQMAEEEGRYWEEYARKNPCVGCGYCCRKAPCHLADHYGTMEDNGKGELRCTMLRWDEEHSQYRCRFLEDPKTEHHAQDIHIGVGCCCSLFNQDREKIPHPSECGWGHILTSEE